MTAPAISAQRSVAIALAVVVVGAILTGFAPILVRLAVAEGVGPVGAAFWRFVFSLPLLAVWTLLERRASADPDAPGQPDGAGRRSGAWRFVLLAGLFFAGDLATWHSGIVRTGVANATLLPNLTPILVGAAAWLLFRERPTRGLVIGAAAALAGVALLSGAGVAAADENMRSQRLLGDALSALTAIWYAAYMLAVKAARARLATGRLMLLTTLVSAGALVFVALAAGETLVPPSALALLWLVLLGVLVHAGGQGAIAFALGRLPAALAALMILVQPVVAAIAAWFLFGEVLGPLQLAGGVLVLCGIWAASALRPRAAGS